MGFLVAAIPVLALATSDGAQSRPSPVWVSFPKVVKVSVEIADTETLARAN